jgi:FlaG/FlaF family flagellin (archaellin)
MPKFCPTCGKPLQYENAEICPGCGVRIQPPPQDTEIRNPWIAVILSFFFLGWGQWYNGKTWDGVRLFGAAIGTYIVFFLAIFLFSGLPALVGLFTLVLFLVILVIWIYGMYDAYRTAEQINRREVEFKGKSRLFWLPVVLIIVIIITVILAAVIAAFVFGMAGSVQHTKTVAATARQSGNDIAVIWQGGPDNAYVSSYTIILKDSETHSGYPPVVGSTTHFSGGTTGNDHIVVSATFTDGSEQVVLDTYV